MDKSQEDGSEREKKGRKAKEKVERLCEPRLE
jgi:hypothetical protein